MLGAVVSMSIGADSFASRAGEEDWSVVPAVEEVDLAATGASASCTMAIGAESASVSAIARSVKDLWSVGCRSLVRLERKKFRDR